MSDREQLVKQLKNAEQELGVLRFKLKGRKDDRDIFKNEITKLKTDNSTLRDDLACCYKNINLLYKQNSALKRAINVVNLTGPENEAFEKAMGKVKFKDKDVTG